MPLARTEARKPPGWIVGSAFFRCQGHVDGGRSGPPLVERTPQTAVAQGLTNNAGTESCWRLRFYAKRGKGLRLSRAVRVSCLEHRGPLGLWLGGPIGDKVSVSLAGSYRRVMGGLRPERGIILHSKYGLILGKQLSPEIK